MPTSDLQNEFLRVFAEGHRGIAKSITAKLAAPGPFLFFVATIGLLTISCRQSYTVIPTDKLVNMPPFQATVESVYVQTSQSTNFGTHACVGLKTSDGRRVGIGGPNATPEIVGFVQSLQRGQTYTFPEVFVAYQKSKEIKPEASPPSQNQSTNRPIQ